MYMREKEREKRALDIIQTSTHVVRVIYDVIFTIGAAIVCLLLPYKPSIYQMH